MHSPGSTASSLAPCLPPHPRPPSKSSRSVCPPQLSTPLAMALDPTMLSVSVSNVAARECLDGLMHTVKELGEGENTAGVYQCFLARAARRKKGSGLGLARIHAEAEMTLTVSFEGDHVCVEAVAPLP